MTLVLPRLSARVAAGSGPSTPVGVACLVLCLDDRSWPSTLCTVGMAVQASDTFLFALGRPKLPLFSQLPFFFALARPKLPLSFLFQFFLYRFRVSWLGLSQGFRVPSVTSRDALVLLFRALLPLLVCYR